MSQPARTLLVALAVAGLTLPALAQDRPESILPPGFGDPPEQPAPQPQAPSGPQQPASDPASRRGLSGAASPATADGEGGEELSETEEELPPLPPPVELPAHARRDPFVVGVIDPVAAGLGADPWGTASGVFLSTLMRRLDTPLPSRWMHITLRRALLARTEVPRNVHPADWVAERAWLLLRLGEADAARLLVDGVDVDRFTPKLFQVAVQTALATSDPAALCRIGAGIDAVERKIAPVTNAMCAALSGEAATASAAIDAIRRRGAIRGIDLWLAQKLIGAGSDTRRAVTIEWDGVEQLSAWRYGLATATGLAPPERLVAAAAPQLRSWLARAPLLSAEQRLAAARFAAAQGVFSSAALVDLYSTLYDMADPEELAGSDAWQLRTAFVGRSEGARIAAMRRLWSIGNSDGERYSSQVLLARAASRIVPSADHQDEAADLIASMLAGGLDARAGRWSAAVEEMDGEVGDRSWAMLALAAPDGVMRISSGRLDDFIDNDSSQAKRRSGLLVAGLTGLGRIDPRTGARLSTRYGFGLDRPTRWSRLTITAARRPQPATTALLAATGLQTGNLERLSAARLFHIVAALRRSGQDYAARMIAAEALARS